MVTEEEILRDGEEVKLVSVISGGSASYGNACLKLEMVDEMPQVW